MRHLSISSNHILVVILIILLIIFLISYGIYKLIKIAVRKGTSEAIEKENPKNKKS